MESSTPQNLAAFIYLSMKFIGAFWPIIALVAIRRLGRIASALEAVRDRRLDRDRE